MATEVIARQGDMVDLICWRHYGYTAEITEQVIDANPGLADRGPILPHGLAVILPDPVSKPAPAIQLWD